MRKFMLDTNICIYTIKNKPETLRPIFNAHDGQMCVSRITHMELAVHQTQIGGVTLLRQIAVPGGALIQALHQCAHEGEVALVELAGGAVDGDCRHAITWTVRPGNGGLRCHGHLVGIIACPIYGIRTHATAFLCRYDPIHYAQAGSVRISVFAALRLFDDGDRRLRRIERRGGKVGLDPTLPSW